MQRSTKAIAVIRAERDELRAENKRLLGENATLLAQRARDARQVRHVRFSCRRCQLLAPLTSAAVTCACLKLSCNGCSDPQARRSTHALTIVTAERDRLWENRPQ